MTTIVIKSNILLFLSIILQRLVGGNGGDLVKGREILLSKLQFSIVNQKWNNERMH